MLLFLPRKIDGCNFAHCARGCLRCEAGVAKAPPIPKCTLEPRWLDCDDDDGDDGGDHDDDDEDADVDVVWR